MMQAGFRRAWSDSEGDWPRALLLYLSIPFLARGRAPAGQTDVT